MKVYQVILNGRQYEMLEKMLCSGRAGQLARNQSINGYELFSDMLHDICAPATDGWCTFDTILEESVKELDLLKFITKVVFPEDENYFVRQIGKNFQCEWEKIALYAGETGFSRMAFFYFYTEDGEHHYNTDIWEKYGVNEREYRRLMEELRKINKSLWLEFKDSGEETWYSFTFHLDKDGKFNMKYSYENNEELDAMQAHIRWAYDDLGIIPRDKYSRKLLKEYLVEQERELPEELKDI